MIYVVLYESSPGQYLLSGTYDVATVTDAYGMAAGEHPESDVFYAAALADFAQDRVADRRSVIDWQSTLTTTMPTSQ